MRLYPERRKVLTADELPRYRLDSVAGAEIERAVAPSEHSHHCARLLLHHLEQGIAEGITGLVRLKAEKS